MQSVNGITIKIIANGPYKVTGNVPLQLKVIGSNAQHESEEWLSGKSITPEKQPFFLCRCGHSDHKPFCDNTHAKINFNGTTTAEHKSYQEQAHLQEGPTMLLTDAKKLCAAARFCDPNGQVWHMIYKTDDPSIQAQFKKQVHHCPSGRLVAWDKANSLPVEPELTPAIGIIEDPEQNASGPLWVQGGIEIMDAKGISYEIRNRVTLCRCGASSNKPFCDGSHLTVGFKDGLME